MDFVKPAEIEPTEGLQRVASLFWHDFCLAPIFMHKSTQKRKLSVFAKPALPLAARVFKRRSLCQACHRLVKI